MRVTLPTWSEWTTGIKSIVETSVKRAGIPASAPITGAPTNLQVSADDKNASVKMPYCKVWLSGWAPTETQQKPIELDWTFTGTSAISSFKTSRDTLAFTISFYSKDPSQLTDLIQSVFAYMGTSGTISITKNSISYDAPFSLGNYSLDVREDLRGNILHYSAEIDIQLQVLSERTRNDAVSTAIQTVIVATETEVIDDGTSLDETITFE